MQAAALRLAPQAHGFKVTIREAPLADPLDVLANRAGCFYARIPGENLEIAAAGKAWEVQAEGPARFQRVRDAARGLFEAIPAGTPPLRLWGGFSFASETHHSAWGGFGAAWWFLPAYQYVLQNGRAYEITVEGPPSSSAPPPAAKPMAPLDAASWHRAAGNALAAVMQGEFSKVVLARPHTIRKNRAWHMPTVLEALRMAHPGALLAFRRENRWFLSATPELLGTTDRGHFTSQAVAGTTRRGGNVEEDDRLAAALLASEKDRREHRWVVDSICAALAPIVESVVQASAPLTMRLPNVMHLVTPIQATLLPGSHHLDTIARLHPTAAVGGFPRAAALEWLRTHEPFDRGWYAGPIGWVDAEGNGSTWVAIRSALVHDQDAVLFAGAGLVAGSKPEIEWDETGLKLELLRGILEMP